MVASRLAEIDFLSHNPSFSLMTRRDYIIYSDESDRRGKFYSNFFGGVLLEASDQQRISEALNARKAELGILSEVKWQRVDATNTDRYAEFIRMFFEFVAASRLKVRIMFTQNIYEPRGLEQRHHEDGYFILYYQLIKHAFGIAHCNPGKVDDVYISVLPDMIPDTQERRERFMNYLSRIPESRLLQGRGLHIPREGIADVDSKAHVILQGLDLVLGSMCWRLNDKHLEKPEGQRIRGKRTLAKLKLYKVINKEIRAIYPNFNIGMTTGAANGVTDRWTHPYRHWRFMPSTYEVKLERGKRANRACE